MRRIVDAAIFAGVVAAITLALVLTPPARGPLYQWQSDGGYSGVGLWVNPGHTTAFDWVLPRTPADAVLIDLRPLHPQQATSVTLRYGMRYGGPQIEGRRGWHPRKWNMQPVSGFLIPAKTEGFLTIGLSSQVPGKYHIKGFIVDYRIGALTYSAPQQFGVDLCVNASYKRCGR